MRNKSEKQLIITKIANLLPYSFKLSNYQIGQANLDEVINPLLGLKIYASTSSQDKLARIEVLYIK